MPRELRQNERNKLVIEDPFTGEKVELFYRMPSVSEHVDFQKQSYLYKQTASGTITENNTPQTRIDFGLKILTGFTDGYFLYDGKPISPDPKSPDYRQDWKELIKETAANLVDALGMKVFLGVRFVNENEEEDAGAHPLPLVKSSDV